MPHESCLGRGARAAAMQPGRRVRWLLMDYSLSYGHHGLRPCSKHLGEGTVSMRQATGPIYTCETTGHAPAAVLDAHPERRRGTVSLANLHPAP